MNAASPEGRLQATSRVLLWLAWKSLHVDGVVSLPHHGPEAVWGLVTVCHALAGGVGGILGVFDTRASLLQTALSRKRTAQPSCVLPLRLCTLVCHPFVCAVPHSSVLFPITQPSPAQELQGASDSGGSAGAWTLECLSLAEPGLWLTGFRAAARILPAPWSPIVPTQPVSAWCTACWGQSQMGIWRLGIPREPGGCGHI